MSSRWPRMEMAKESEWLRCMAGEGAGARPRVMGREENPGVEGMYSMGRVL